MSESRSIHFQNEEGLNYEQRVKFCSVLLEKYDIKMDPNNELLPQYYLCHKSAMFNLSLINISKDQLLNMLDDYQKITKVYRQEVVVGKNEISKIVEQSRTGIEQMSNHCIETMLKNNEALDTKVSKILESFPPIKQYNFASSKQAFWHGFSRLGLPVIVIAILLFILAFKYLG